MHYSSVDYYTLGRTYPRDRLRDTYSRIRFRLPPEITSIPITLPPIQTYALTLTISAARTDYRTAAVAMISGTSFIGPPVGITWRLNIDQGASILTGVFDANGAATVNLGIQNQGAHLLTLTVGAQGAFQSASALAILVVLGPFSVTWSSSILAVLQATWSSSAANMGASLSSSAVDGKPTLSSSAQNSVATLSSSAQPAQQSFSGSTPTPATWSP